MGRMMYFFDHACVHANLFRMILYFAGQAV